MKKIILLFVMIFGLSGCNQSPQTINSQGEVVAEKTVSINGPYKMNLPLEESPIRGIVKQSDSYPTIDAMEAGLLKLAPNYVSTKYYYQQGQILSGEDASLLLNHHLSDEEFNQLKQTDPNAQNIGLNPIIKADDPNSEKNMVTTLLEQDFYTGSGDEKEIKTVVIGVGLNLPMHLDQNTKQLVFDDFDKFLTYDGKLIANQLISTIRSKDGYNTIPIMFGFYQQSKNPIIPGNFIAQGYVNENQQTLETIDKVNQEYVPFLDQIGINKDIDLNNKVQTLKNDLINYFGTDVNLSCTGFYEDNKLKHLDFTIIFPSNSMLEGGAIVNFIENELNNKINVNCEINASVVSATGTPIGSLIKRNNKITKIINQEGN